jgi:hypothetical protein
MEEEQRQGIDITKFYSSHQRKFDFPDENAVS